MPLSTTVLVGSALLAAVSAFPQAQAPPSTKIWTPPMNSTFQIILSGTMKLDQRKIVPDVNIFEVDLFDTPAKVIRGLRDRGKSVMCYFSAGTSEDWRPDYKKFLESDKGACLPDWEGERYVDVRSKNVLSIMYARIDLAASVGCSAIDPDNVDGFANTNGLNLTANDYVVYLQNLAGHAAQHGLATGLKNAQQILTKVKNFVQFAVNEECALGGDYGDCESYRGFGKPVFHIEYSKNCNVSAKDRERLCLVGREVPGFFTIIKHLSLDGWGLFCDGTEFETPVTNDKLTIQGLKESKCKPSSDSPATGKKPQGCEKVPA